MQSVGPYRFTHMLGTSPVGKAWAAIDGQGRFVTVAVLDAAVASTPGWREAFAGTANAMAQTPGGQAFAYADFSVAEPWVAYPAEVGPGAEKLFRALGQDYQPAPSDEDDASAPVSGLPQTAVPHQVSGPPQSVSAPPQQVSGPPQPVSGAPQPTSGAPAPWALHAGPLPTVPPAPVPQPVSAAPAPPPSTPAPAPATPDVPRSPAQPPAPVPPYDPFADSTRRIRPSEPPKRRTGLWAGVAALVVVVALASGAAVWALSGTDTAAPQVTPTAFPTDAAVDPGLKPWAEAAPYSPDERALAVAAPSMVFVEAIFTGYVRDSRTKALLRAEPVTFTRRCSGFLVTPDGNALTSSTCVAPAEDRARWLAVDALARVLVQEKKLASGDLSRYVGANLPKVLFTGAEPGTEATVEVRGQLNNAKGNLTNDPAIPAEVVRSLPEDGGNTALIKLARDRLPAVELNPSTNLAENDSLLVLGFTTTDTVFYNATYRPRSKRVTITGTTRSGPVSMYRISEDLGTVSHGGVALDPTGRVVGVIGQDQALPDRANRALVPASTVGALLDEAGVRNTLGDTDKAYRSGLDAYFGGDLSTAVTQFQTVTTAAPANVLAEAYRQNAAELQRLNGGPQERSVAFALLGGAAGALLVGLVVLVVVLVRRSRR